MSKPVLRQARVDECEAISALCMRSKAHWGYDERFMEACRDELTMTPEMMERMEVWVADAGERPVAVAAFEPTASPVEVELMFVEPDAIGTGVGRQLFEHLLRRMRARGVERVHIHSDPGARAFYEHMGARLVGEAPSLSIPGRMLPELVIDL